MFSEQTKDIWASIKNVANPIALRLYHHRLLYILILSFSVLSIFDIINASVFVLPSFIKVSFTIFVSFFKTTILMIPLVMLWRHKYLRIAGYCIIAIFGMMAIVNFVSYEVYGFGITRKLLLITAQTTWPEFCGFLPQLFSNIVESLRSPWPYLAISAFIILLYFVHNCTFRPFIFFIVIATCLGMCSLVAFSVHYTTGRTAIFTTLRIVKYGHEVMDWNTKFQELQQQKKGTPFSETVRSDHLAKTVIVVIGESASRQHHSLYGYTLPTTPCLDRRKADLFAYSNAIGSSSSTAGNMERILSFKPDDRTSGDGLDYPLLVDVFLYAGYKVFWLSNQERTGTVSNTAGVMISNASVIKYAGAENSEDALSYKFDEVLLPELAIATADTVENKLIFLHLMGSHTQYKHRYPQEFSRFNASDEAWTSRPWLKKNMAQTVAEYDNSILYTDHVLNHIMNKVDMIENSAIFIYFSDHGDNVYDEGTYWGRSEKYVDVPYIIYPNSQYRIDNPGITTRLAGTIDKKISTANFIHQLLTLTGTDYKLYDASRDVLSPDFTERVRYVDEKEEFN